MGSCTSFSKFGDENGVDLRGKLFRTFAIIGKGQFGKVFAALHKQSHRIYALKEIKKSKSLVCRSGVQMLFVELSALQRLSHPYISHMYFAFQDVTSCYFVIDLLEGGDLRYYLKDGCIFSEFEAGFIGACLLDAVGYMHSQLVIHRDIKPENIILDRRGFPHIVDFGIAHVEPKQVESGDNNSSSQFTACDQQKLCTNSSLSDTCCTLISGTKAYMAPEMFSSTHVHGPAVDYWAVGVVLYELQLGSRPFPDHPPVAMTAFVETLIFPDRTGHRGADSTVSWETPTTVEDTSMDVCEDHGHHDDVTTVRAAGASSKRMSPIPCSRCPSGDPLPSSPARSRGSRSSSSSGSVSSPRPRSRSSHRSTHTRPRSARISSALPCRGGIHCPYNEPPADLQVKLPVRSVDLTNRDSNRDGLSPRSADFLSCLLDLRPWFRARLRIAPEPITTHVWLPNIHALHERQFRPTFVPNRKRVVANVFKRNVHTSVLPSLKRWYQPSAEEKLSITQQSVFANFSFNEGNLSSTKFII